MQTIETIGCAWEEDAQGETLPGDVVNAILDGASPLRAWRLYRGLKLDVLAERIGVSKGYLSQNDESPTPGRPPQSSPASAG